MNRLWRIVIFSQSVKLGKNSGTQKESGFDCEVKRNANFVACCLYQ